nr:Chain C, Peptide from Dendrin [Mus musculus]6JJZ_D Chain D, Peptide from Dendrin [Mus musculus]
GPGSDRPPPYVAPPSYEG